MTTLDDLYTHNLEVLNVHDRYRGLVTARDRIIRRCYAEGNATLQQLATATGLSRQRIHMIVREGEE